MNRNKLASRLRFVASQCSTEAQRPEWRNSLAKPNLQRAAIQCMAAAHAVQRGSLDVQAALAIRDVALDDLFKTIIARTDLERVTR